VFLLLLVLTLAMRLALVHLLHTTLAYVHIFGRPV
jgi:hypothetical protein